MALSSLTVMLVAKGPHGLVETCQETRPLTESALIEAGLLLLSGDTDERGRVVVALRASKP